MRRDYETKGKEGKVRGGWEADTGNHVRSAELLWTTNNAVCGLNVDELSQLHSMKHGSLLLRLFTFFPVGPDREVLSLTEEE